MVVKLVGQASQTGGPIAYLQRPLDFFKFNCHLNLNMSIVAEFLGIGI